ncbi:MAG TPA: F0F1 ATP synthase subunit B' [Alphaproteobacteria bacterium]|nr:F0F1 ATP synthase subunit B' [Alphaproteobacteria bacterium]
MITRAKRAGLRLAGGATALLVPAMALAQEAATAAHDAAAAGGEAHSAGLPQLNPAVFAPQLFWLAVTFIVLYILMSKVALPRVGEVLEERQERITDDLDAAQARRAEADAVIAAYQKAVADARAEAGRLLARANDEVAQAGARRTEEVAAAIAAKTAEAERRIAAAKDADLSQVGAIAADIARQAAAKLGGVEADPAAAAGAVAAAMQEGR